MIAATPAAADPFSVAGTWDISLDASHRRCRVTLGVEPAAGGYALRMPATCRRALPLLGRATGWTLESDRIRLFDAGGTALLSFEPGPEPMQRLARTEAGEVFRLQRDATRPPPRPPPPPPPLVPQATRVDPATAPAFESLPGTYLVDRYSEREVCRLALDPVPAARPDRFAVRLLEGCRDTGLAAFDPAGWRYAAGRLTLTSRKGFEVDLISEQPGRWRRDPEVGATLILRKAP